MLFMKKIKFPVYLLLVLLGFVVVSCSKDDEGEKNEGPYSENDYPQKIMGEWVLVDWESNTAKIVNEFDMIGGFITFGSDKCSYSGIGGPSGGDCQWNIVGSAVTLTSFDTVFNILLLSDSTLKMNMGDVICTFRKSGNLDVTDAKRFLTVGYWNLSTSTKTDYKNELSISRVDNTNPKPRKDYEGGVFYFSKDGRGIEFCCGFGGYVGGSDMWMYKDYPFSWVINENEIIITFDHKPSEPIKTPYLLETRNERIRLYINGDFYFSIFPD